MIAVDKPIDGPSVWTRRDVRAEDYLLELSPLCFDEIRRAVDEIGTFPLPAILRGPDDFTMPACRRAMNQVRQILDHGRRFAIVDRLPVAEMNGEEATAIYWLLSSMVSRPVAQKLDGTMIYDVLDTGQQALPGSGIRPDKTNIEIRFHNDNAYNDTPPDYVGLLCLRQAQSGGHSRVISFHTAHNLLLARHQSQLERLYQPFWFDRQREYHPGEQPVFAAPVFESREALARFSVHQSAAGTRSRVSRLTRMARRQSRRCSTFSRTMTSRSISTWSPDRSSSCTTGPSAIAVRLLSMIRSPTAGGISSGCGCATMAAVPIPAEAR